MARKFLANAALSLSAVGVALTVMLTGCGGSGQSPLSRISALPPATPVVLVTAPQGSGTQGAASAIPCDTTNLALHQPATASSFENGGFSAAAAVDGNAMSRWSSAFSDPQWLQVDLGGTRAVCAATLKWERASARAFTITASNDGVTWTPLYSTTTGTGGTQTIALGGVGRYIRMTGTQRNTTYGYSIYELQVFGNSMGSTPAPSPSASIVPSPSPSAPLPVARKSAKRGLAYDISQAGDLAAIAPGVSWWYNWGAKPNAGIADAVATSAHVAYVPMLWNFNFDAAAIEAYLAAHPAIDSILVLNEPNLSGQANVTPQAAAQQWPRYEAVAAASHVKIVGPAMTWGTMTGYADPVAWLDAFYAAYRAANGRDPQIDALAFHWYDYGLGAQLNRLTKYGKPFWVTEFANWHAQNDGAQITTLAQQEAQMTDMVATCENRADVVRYAWFTGRVSPDPHYDSVLGASGARTALGDWYLTRPFVGNGVPQ